MAATRKSPAKPKRTYRPRAAPELGDMAIVTVYLDRATGEVTTDTTFSTVMESWAMLSRAAEDSCPQRIDLDLE